MQKINFKNLPDTSTPLNAENLNLMQDNIESAIEDVEDVIPTIENSLDSDSTTDAPSVHTVNTALTYTKLGTITGDSTINLPNTWKELYAVIDLNGQKYQFTILKQFLDDYTGSSDFSFRHGAYLTGGANQGCSVHINNSKTIIRINEAYQSGSDIKSSAILTVFYK